MDDDFNQDELKEIPEGFHEELEEDALADDAEGDGFDIYDKKKSSLEEVDPETLDSDLIEYMHEGLYND